ncbi:MAG TPA: hypothetical protein VGM73_02675 [Candidatus Didemnitutus sp.]
MIVTTGMAALIARAAMVVAAGSRTMIVATGTVVMVVVVAVTIVGRTDVRGTSQVDADNGAAVVAVLVDIQGLVGSVSASRVS